MSDKININDICGVCWFPDKPDDLSYSVRVNGEIVRGDIPELTAKLKRTALEKGWTLGKLADWINAAINRAGERRPLSPFEFRGSVTTQLTDEQAASFAKVFGFDYTPTSSEERADQVDGLSE